MNISGASQLSSQRHQLIHSLAATPPMSPPLTCPLVLVSVCQRSKAIGGSPRFDFRMRAAPSHDRGFDTSQRVN
jgi:hypothetical protein